MPSTGFTPNQHRTIRTHLALIPLYVWLVYIWSLFWNQLPAAGDPSHAHLVRDFLHFYTQGVIARQHDVHALYDVAAMASAADRALPGVPKHVFPPVYGPQVALFFAPMAALSYVSALYVWLAVTIVGSGACLYLVWRHADDRQALGAWVVAVLALGAPGLHFTLSFAQVSVLGLAAFTALWLALQHQRPFLAGVAVGLLAYKPQLGIVAAAVFVFHRQWRVVAGATMTVAVQALMAAACWGPSVFGDYVGALRRLPAFIDAMEPDKHVAFSMRAVLLALHVPSTASVVISLALSIVVVVIGVATWRASVPLALRYSALVFATLLVNPHLYGYDLLIATPAMLLAGAWAWHRRRRVALTLLALLYIGPIAGALLPGPPLAVPLALAGLVLTIWTETAATTPRTISANQEVFL